MLLSFTPVNSFCGVGNTVVYQRSATNKTLMTFRLCISQATAKVNTLKQIVKSLYINRFISVLLLIETCTTYFIMIKIFFLGTNTITCITNFWSINFLANAGWKSWDSRNLRNNSYTIWKTKKQGEILIDSHPSFHYILKMK